MRWRFRIYGVIFGLLVTGIYITISVTINGLLSPGIHLVTQRGGAVGQVMEYLVLGAVVGLVCTLFESTVLSSVLGGFTSAIWMFIVTWFNGFDAGQVGLGVLVLVVAWFLPLTVLLTPLALLVRLSINTITNPDRNFPSWKRFGITLATLLGAILLGVITLYPADVRADMRYTDALIRQGLQAVSTEEDLPKPLQGVNGFTAGAVGSFTLEYARVNDTGQKQIMVIARFQSGYAMTCVFIEENTIPACINGSLR